MSSDLSPLQEEALSRGLYWWTLHRGEDHYKAWKNKSWIDDEILTLDGHEIIAEWARADVFPVFYYNGAKLNDAYNVPSGVLPNEYASG